MTSRRKTFLIILLAIWRAVLITVSHEYALKILETETQTNKSISSFVEIFRRHKEMIDAEEKSNISKITTLSHKRLDLQSPQKKINAILESSKNSEYYDKNTEGVL